MSAYSLPSIFALSTIMSKHMKKPKKWIDLVQNLDLEFIIKTKIGKERKSITLSKNVLMFRRLRTAIKYG